MTSKKPKQITQQDLKTKTKAILKAVNRGVPHIINRYSQPVGVVLSMEEYTKLSKHNCQQCQIVINKLKEVIKNEK